MVISLKDNLGQGSMPDHHYSLDHSPIPSFSGQDNLGIFVISNTSQHPLVIIFQLVTMTPLSIPLPNMFPLLNMSPLPNMFTYNIGLFINQLLWNNILCVSVTVSSDWCQISYLNCKTSSDSSVTDTVSQHWLTLTRCGYVITPKQVF